MNNQADMILRYMQDCGTITPLDAMREFGCMRLSARIWDLRHAGHRISQTLVTSKNRYGNTTTYAEYRLED